MRTDVRTCLLILVWLINHHQLPAPTGIQVLRLLLSLSLTFSLPHIVEGKWLNCHCSRDRGVRGLRDTWARVTDLSAEGWETPRQGTQTSLCKVFLLQLGRRQPGAEGWLHHLRGASKERGTGRGAVEGYPLHLLCNPSAKHGTGGRKVCYKPVCVSPWTGIPPEMAPGFSRVFPASWV